MLGRNVKQEVTSKIVSSALTPEQEKLWSQYEKLDSDDKSEIRGEIKGMLRHEKYQNQNKRKQA